MAKQSGNRKPNYIVDQRGKRVSVVLPMEEFDELMEDLSDLAMVAERRGEKTAEHAEVIKRLKTDGLIAAVKS